MVGMLLSQKDCGLASESPTAVGMLMQLVASVHEPRAAEQCATCVALGNVPMPWRRLALQHASVVHAVCHICAGAATFSISCEQGCVAAVEVMDSLLQLNKLTWLFVSRRLGRPGSMHAVSVEGRTCSVA